MRHASHRGAAAVAGKRRHGVVWNVLGVLMEILFTLAAVCALYIVWQMWWTGVQAEHEQVEARQSVAWENPATDGEQTKVAPKQEGDPPVQPEQAAEGDLIAQIYIPRFGDQWERNIVEGTTLEQLNKHGMGHYTTSQMPGRRGGSSQRLRPAVGRRRQAAAGRRDRGPHSGLLVRVPLHRV